MPTPPPRPRPRPGRFSGLFPFTFDRPLPISSRAKERKQDLGTSYPAQGGCNSCRSRLVITHIEALKKIPNLRMQWWIHPCHQLHYRVILGRTWHLLTTRALSLPSDSVLGAWSSSCTSGPPGQRLGEQQQLEHRCAWDGRSGNA